MKILFLHELDTGFMAATLKPAFIRLGHECVVIQGWNTHLETNTNHVDYLLKEFPKEDKHLLIDEFKDTDFFIIRAGDALMEDTGILPYLNQYNMVYRLHGHDLTALGRPYKLKAYMIDWYGKEPYVATYCDPTFLHLLRPKTVYIERPVNLDLIPKKKKSKEVFALNSPSDTSRKGAEELLKIWKPNDNIKLKLISNTDREEVLALKSKASYVIDNLSDEYDGGPYGMNAVEAWLMSVPVFSRYCKMSEVICPELSNLVTYVTLDTVQGAIEDYVVDKKRLKYIKDYAMRVHSPTNIAQIYIKFAQAIIQRVKV